MMILLLLSFISLTVIEIWALSNKESFHRASIAVHQKIASFIEDNVSEKWASSMYNITTENKQYMIYYIWASISAILAPVVAFASLFTMFMFRHNNKE